jgi:hypothetical protein
MLVKRHIVASKHLNGIRINIPLDYVRKMDIHPRESLLAIYNNGEIILRKSND